MFIVYLVFVLYADYALRNYNKDRINTGVTEKFVFNILI